MAGAYCDRCSDRPREAAVIARTVFAALLLAGSTAALADPPDHAPAYGYRAKHPYVYYPSRQIYYAPESRSWFWISGGSWQVGVSLPAYLEQYTVGGVSIELDTDRPYTQNAYVVEHYGRGGGNDQGDDDDQGHGHVPPGQAKKGGKGKH